MGSTAVISRSKSRLISQAKTPLVKSSPRSMLVFSLASLIGLILGAGVAMLRDISDRVFRTTSQIRERLSADCISLVPLARGVYVSAPDRSSAKDALDLVAGPSAATGRSGSATSSSGSAASSSGSATVSTVSDKLRRVSSWLFRVSDGLHRVRNDSGKSE